MKYRPPSGRFRPLAHDEWNGPDDWTSEASGSVDRQRYFDTVSAVVVPSGHSLGGQELAIVS